MLCSWEIGYVYANYLVIIILSSFTLSLVACPCLCCIRKNKKVDKQITKLPISWCYTHMSNRPVCFPITVTALLKVPKS